MKRIFNRTLILLLVLTFLISENCLASNLPDGYENVIRSPRVTRGVKGEEQVTIMVYMNGSDLESEDQEATTDLIEMIKAGSSDNVTVLVQTMGTKKWSSKLKIASNRSQIYQVTGDGLKLLKDDLGQLDCTQTKTLQDFVTWSAKNYPADRYILQFWDHGGGPVYGFGYDEYQDWNASLTMDEIQAALRNAGVFFDFIGMDCCIMSNLEVCCALYDFCDYVILSEDFESGLGWYYTNWLKKLYKNPSIDTTTLAKTIIDDMVKKNEEDSESGDESILSLIDEGKMKLLMTAWMDFAYKNEKALTGNNYSQKRTRSGTVRVLEKFQRSNFFSWWNDEDEDDTSMSDYYVTDIMAVAQNINSKESAALEAALNSAIVYSNCTSGNAGMTGLAISLPYGDSEFYSEMKTVYTNCGFDKEYVTWLGKFVNASGKDDYYDYEEWEDDWSGWDDYDEDYDWSIWDFFLSDEDEEYWDDDSNWGWSGGYDDDDDYYDDDDDYDDIFGFFDWLFSDDDDYDDDDYYDDDDDDYEGFLGFLEWLLED